MNSPFYKGIPNGLIPLVDPIDYADSAEEMGGESGEKVGEKALELALTAGAGKVISKIKVNFSTKQLDKKFKHAPDFGVVTTKKNPVTMAQYEAAIKSHLFDSRTVQKGTYGWVKDSKVYFNRTTNNIVVVDKTENFVTAFKLAPRTPQYTKFIKDGILK